MKLDKENPELIKVFENFKESLAACKNKAQLKKDKAKKCKGKCGGPKKMSKAEDMTETETPEMESECECCDMCEEVCMLCDSLGCYCDYLQKRIDMCYNYIYQLESALYEHSSTGHLPKLTPSQLTSLLKAAGAEKDYSVQPKIIYASKKGFEIDMVRK